MDDIAGFREYEGELEAAPRGRTGGEKHAAGDGGGDVQRLSLPVVEKSAHRLRRHPRLWLLLVVWVSFQGRAIADGKPAAVRPLLLARKPAEHLQLLFPHGSLEAAQENVHARACRGDHLVPRHPHDDALRGAVPVRGHSGARHPAPFPGGGAVHGVRVVYPVVRPLRPEVHGRVLVRAEGPRVARARHESMYILRYHHCRRWCSVSGLL